MALPTEDKPLTGPGMAKASRVGSAGVIPSIGGMAREVDGSSPSAVTAPKASTAFPHNPPPPGRVYGQSQQGLGVPKASSANDTYATLANDTASNEGQFGRLVDAVFAPSGTPEQVARIRPGVKAPPTPVAQASYSNEGRNYPAAVKTTATPAETPLPAGAPKPMRNFSTDLGRVPNTLPSDLPQGVIHKTMDANGRSVYSGANVGFGAKMVDGAGLEVAQRGSVDVAQAGSMVAGPGGYGFAPATGQDQVGAQARQAQISQTLTNPDGSKWSAQDNATMAANLRDGVNPYLGTSRTPRMTAGQAYAQKAMNAPRTLANLTPKQMARIQDQALQIDAQAANAQNAEARFGMDRSRLDMERQRLAGDMANSEMSREEKGLGIKSAKQIADLQAQYLVATDDATKAQIAKTLREISGKEAKSADWAVQVTPATKNIDGSTTAGSVIRYNKATGQVEKVDGLGADGPAPEPAANHINALKLDPSLAAKFDEKYGQGASSKYLKNG